MPLNGNQAYRCDFKGIRRPPPTMRPNMGGPNKKVLTPPPNRGVMLSVARTLVNRATDKIICTGPPEGAMMGLAHQMSAFVAPAARHTSKVLAFKKPW